MPAMFDIEGIVIAGKVGINKDVDVNDNEGKYQDLRHCRS